MDCRRARLRRSCLRGGCTGPGPSLSIVTVTGVTPWHIASGCPQLQLAWSSFPFAALVGVSHELPCCLSPPFVVTPRRPPNRPQVVSDPGQFFGKVGIFLGPDGDGALGSRRGSQRHHAGQRARKLRNSGHRGRRVISGKRAMKVPQSRQRRKTTTSVCCMAFLLSPM